MIGANAVAHIGARVDLRVEIAPGLHPRVEAAITMRAVAASGDMTELPEHVRRNRAQWDAWTGDYEEAGRRNWSAPEPSWGIFGVPESQLGVLPQTPDASFDLAISEYGASIWCDPHRWIPEAARVLRPGGRLIFLVNGVFAMLTIADEENGAAGDRLLRPYFGMHRVEWSADDSVEFHLPHGEMLGLLRRCGFEVEELLEIQPPEGSTTRYPFVSLEWARQWPCEEVWKARKVHAANP